MVADSRYDATLKDEGISLGRDDLEFCSGAVEAIALLRKLSIIVEDHGNSYLASQRLPMTCVDDHDPETTTPARTMSKVSETQELPKIDGFCIVAVPS